MSIRDEMKDLAIEIADAQAVCAINSYSYRSNDEKYKNIDVDSRSEYLELQTCARYLELRGKLKRHPKNKHLVKVLP